MNKLTARDIRLMFGYLDAIDRLTELLRREHFDVPYERVYGAIGGAGALREKLFLVAISGIEVEPIPVPEVNTLVRKSVPSVPATQTELV